MLTQPAATSRWEPKRLLFVIVSAISGAWIVSLTIALLTNHWIVDQHNAPVITDYLEVWVAGKSALQGAAASAYDPHLHHVAQVAAVGHPFNGFLGWHYPPLFLFAAAALAFLPYLWSFVIWVSVTFALYVPVLSQIARRREAALVALASPLSLTNIWVGQNAFLSGALIGGTLLFMETRPLLSGMFLGLLTYKPQLGLLFPLALLSGKRWRVLVSATVTAAAAILASFAAFGGGAFRAFLHFLPITEKAILLDGKAGWNKLQTAYGVARWLGAGNEVAWIVQGTAALACAAWIVWLWRRSDICFAIKAAALSAAALVMTPYLYMYDLPILAVPLAFLFRARHFDPIEGVWIMIANLLIVAFVLFKAPVGFAMILIVLCLVVRRSLESRVYLAPHSPLRQHGRWRALERA